MIPYVVFPALGLLLIVLGWPMAARRVPPNRWYGLRVPATFANRHVWYEANALTGRDMILLGAVITVVALVLARVPGLPPAAYSLFCAILLGIGSLIFTLRGWRAANRMLREHDAGRDE